MAITTRTTILTMLAGLALSGAAVAQVANPESEPNDGKVGADDANSVGAGMQATDFITGSTTGTSTTTPGAASADYFRVTVKTAPLAIYRHRLQLTTTGTTGHVGSIRGRSQSGLPGVINATSDVAVQNSVAISPGGYPARTVQWFGFGKGEQFFYSVTGTASTTSAYTATMSTSTVSPLTAAGTVQPGSVTVTSVGQGHTSDTDFWVYDANLDPVAGFGNDDTAGDLQSAATAVIPAGNYYVAMSNFNIANNQASPASEENTFNTFVTDNAGLIASSSSSSALNVSFAIVSGTGTVAVPATKAGAFDVVWVAFSAGGPSAPTGVGAVSPSSTDNCGTSSVVLTVNVTPGDNPASTGIAVVGNLTTIGGGAAQAFSNDGVTGGDVSALDNIWTWTQTVPNTVATGAKATSFTVSDSQARSSGGNFPTITVLGCPPTCPAGDVVFTLPAMNSFGLQGDAGNTVSVQNTASTLTVTKLRVGGRLTEVNTSTLLDEARLRVTTPDGTVFTFGGPGSAWVSTSGGTNVYDINGQEFDLPGGELATGSWTFETHEGDTTFANDSGNDAIWSPMCVSLVSVPANPSGSGAASNPLYAGTPFGSGSSSGTLVFDLNRGNPPATTFTVTVNAGALGLGTITLLDDGVAPDAVAGDYDFSGSIAVTPATPLGFFSLPVAIADNLGRNGTGTMGVSVEPGVIDLGVVSTINQGLLVNDQTMSIDRIHWHKMTLGRGVLAAAPTGPEWLDVTSNDSTDVDTEIGVYRADGTRVADNDDEGLGNDGALSFGAGSGVTLGVGGATDGGSPTVSAGQNGATLAEGEYYVAVGRFNTAFGSTNFDVFSTATQTGGTYDLNVTTNVETCDSIDFNGDGIFPDNQDVIDFIEVFGGGVCPTGTCDDIDFNNDGVFPDNGDITAFIISFGGGGCP
jgi:hypothetical protein